MQRYAVFYGDDDAPVEVYLIHADDKEHALEQFRDEYPDELVLFVFVEI